MIRFSVGSITLFFLVFMLTGCMQKGLSVKSFSPRQCNIPIFIEMPRNTHVFDNVAPLLYQALHQHYLRTGYVLVDNFSKGYTVKAIVKSLDSSNKLVSPDVVLMHSTIRMTVECSLLDFKQQVIAQKTFFLSVLISKSKNPILGSDFFHFEYKRLFEKTAPRIERFFRKFLFKAFA